MSLNNVKVFAALIGLPLLQLNHSYAPSSEIFIYFFCLFTKLKLIINQVHQLDVAFVFSFNHSIAMDTMFTVYMCTTEKWLYLFSFLCIFQVEGTLSVQPQANPVVGFEQHFLGLTVENNERNPWFVGKLSKYLVAEFPFDG